MNAVLNGDRYEPPTSLNDSNHTEHFFVDLTIPLTDGSKYEMVNHSISDLIRWSSEKVAAGLLSEQTFASISEIYVQISQKYSQRFLIHSMNFWRNEDKSDE